MLALIIASLITAGFAYGAMLPALEGWSNLMISGFWLSGAFALHFLLGVVFWNGLVPRWSGSPVPKLLTQVTGTLIMFVALGMIGVDVYELPVSGLLTTSGVFIAIVGFALRNMIADLFTGIALGLERPFSVGDWIQIPDGSVGQVVEINWRSTRLITREEISVIIPNSELAISTFRNYSRPERAWRDEFEILLHQYVPAHQAERVFLSAVNQVSEIVAVNKPPEVRIKEYTTNGVVWIVRYWVPDYSQMSSLRYKVQKAISRNMHYAGLTVPAEQIHVAAQGMSPGTGVDLLRRVDLFESLNEDELQQLFKSTQTRLVLRNERVVREGEFGDSLFVVKEGLLEVSIGRESGDQIIVAHLVPGSFFGEMSLLTGDPRHASVTASVDSIVLEISKDTFEPIIQARPEIAQTLSRAIEEREMHNLMQRQPTSPEVEEEQHPLLERIRLFFSLPGNGVH